MLYGFPNVILFLTVSLTIHGFCVTKLIVPFTETLGLGKFYLYFISPSNEYIKDDLPAPIPPIIATIYPLLKEKFISVRVSGGSGKATAPSVSLSQ